MTVTSIQQANKDIRHDWTVEEITTLFNLPFNDLLFKAHSIHREYFNPNEVQISTLLSIKTGGCPEDCKYCPQSVHYDTNLSAEKLLDRKEIIKQAKSAKQAGASRFCMGAAWRELKDRDVEEITGIIDDVKSLELETCMTLGMLTKTQAEALHSAGLDYYNHNIDTSEEFYAQIITTRNFQDRLETLEHVRNAGIKVCCGGIIGMGELLSDRVKMLHTLAVMPEHPESVPINLLLRVEGTPLDSVEALDNLDFIRVIAVARIIMPQSMLRLSAGRENMSDEMQTLCFFAGANSIFYGETLLTQPNPSESEDKKLFARLGINPFTPACNEITDLKQSTQ